MKEGAVTHSTFVIERTYPATRERVFAAFSDPAKKRRWFAEGEEAPLEDFQMDFRVGGFDRTRRRAVTPTSAGEGWVFTNDTVYRDIVAGERIVFAYNMSVGDHCISSSLVTVELLPSGDGTQLIFTEQAAFFAGSDGAQIRETGWRLLLERLAEHLA